MEFLKRLFLILMLTAIIQPPSICGKAITCTAGDFHVGANAPLVCYFPDDIDAHDSVLVQYSPFSAPTDASDVLHCKAEDVKATKSNEQNGYVLKSHTRNTLLIDIINSNEKAAGRYTCQCLPPDDSPRDMCNFTVHGETGTVSVDTLEFVAVVAAVVCIIILVSVIRERFDRCLGMQFPNRLFHLILTALKQAPPTCGKAITCIAGDFLVGANASLDCNFPGDIDNHDSVLVQYYPFSAPTEASDVLLCKVEDIKAKKCNEQNSYALKSRTRNSLLVDIINITDKDAGRYVCQFLPPDHSPREMCNLTVNGYTARVTPGVSQDSSTINQRSGETGTVSVETLVVVVVTVAVVLVAVIIIVVIVFYRRHQRVPAVPLIATQSNDNNAPATGGQAAPLINTQSNGTKTPAAGLAVKQSIQTSVDRAQTFPLIHTKQRQQGPSNRDR